MTNKLLLMSVACHEGRCVIEGCWTYAQSVGCTKFCSSTALLCPHACDGELTHSDKLAAAVFRLAAGSSRSGERRSRNLQFHSAALCPHACNGELTHSDKLAAAVFRLAAGSSRSGERRSRGSDTASPARGLA